MGYYCNGKKVEKEITRPILNAKADTQLGVPAFETPSSKMER
jgi:hypothetical protein